MKPLPTSPQSGPSLTAATAKTSRQSPPYPKIRSSHSNDVTQMIDAEADDRDHDQPAIRQARQQLQGDRDAADLGASVIRFTTSDETSAPSPARNPTRSRTASNTAFPETAATRPHISE